MNSKNNNEQIINKKSYYIFITHYKTVENTGWSSMKYSSKTLQNMLFFNRKSTYFFHFSFSTTLPFPLNNVGHRLEKWLGKKLSCLK